MKRPLQKRLHILHKLKLASDNLVRISILLTKMKKSPMIPKLVSLRKSRKLIYKRFKLRNLNHYSYGYLREYQFDTPATPLIQYYHRRNQLRSSSSIPMLFSWKCFGCLRSQTMGEEDRILALEALPAVIPTFEAASEQLDSEEDSVDERAELFIRRFYAEMRLQRQESF